MARNTECWVILFHGSLTKQSYLPMYPDDISDSQQAIWQSQQIIGRSSPIAAYSGTDARNISFTMTFHREMLGSKDSDMKEIDDILNIFRAALYPKYISPNGLHPPRIRVVLGKFAVEGILTSLSYSWKKPVINGRYMLCDVSVSISGYPSTIKDATNIVSAAYPENPNAVVNLYSR